DILDFFGWNTSVNTASFHSGILRDNGTCRDDAIALHDTIVHNDTAHSNQHIIMDGATVHNGIMAYGHIIANSCWRFLIRGVDNCSILNVYFVTDFNIVDISSNHGIEPNTALLPHHHITNNGGIFGNVAIIRYDGVFPVNWFYNWHS